MRTKKFLYYLKFAPFVILLLSFLYGFKGDNKHGGRQLNKSVIHMNKVTSGKVGDGYRMNVNNLNIPINNTGVIAEVTLPDGGTTNGRFAGHEFLFSGGFYLSGTRNGVPWANAVASASLEKDYLPGTVATGQTPQAQIYVLNSQDTPFGQSWEDWKDAVALGAAYYDGDGDGQYNPVDLNGNGKWDPDEDAPDLLGDETAWCVYNDGLPAAQRYWTTVGPMGIEMRQTVFAFSSSGAIGNLLFIRYRIKYVGLNKPDDPSSLNDVYFGVWSDPDIGEVYGFSHNLVGSDTTRNAGYTYLKNPSPGDWGSQPPCFMIDFFSGPAAYLPGVTFIDENGNGEYDPGETALDSAYSIRGKILGIQSFPGARNQPLSSFVEYINGDAVLSDPQNASQARNLMLGNSVTGETIDPCTWAYGTVRGGIPCADVDPRFWYSGDPVANIGWINTTEGDVRQMSNTGPFTLKMGEEKEIVVAYIVGQGSSPLNSVTTAQQIDDGAQFIFDHNFIAPSPAPPVNPTISSGENFIDLTWDSSPQVSFVDSTGAYNDHFEGYNIYAYKTDNSAETVNNITNKTLVARYTKRDFLNDLYVQNPNTGGIELLYPAPDSAHQLDASVYGNPATGRIRVRISKDPFTGDRLVKGKPYYFSITSYSPNYFALRNKSNPDTTVGIPGDYYISSSSFVGNVENIAKVFTVVLGENEWSPPREIVNSNHVSGGSSGLVGFDIVNQNNLIGNQYEISFFQDSSTQIYSTFWKITDITTNTVLIDSSKTYSYETSNVSGNITDGFIPRVQADTTALGAPYYLSDNPTWYKTFNATHGTGIYYVGNDALFAKNIIKFNIKRSSASSVANLRRIELRFGTNQGGKAYRYINGYKDPSASSRYIYAEAISPTDTIGKGYIGNWDTQTDRAKGFVDVPFTAWVVDSAFNEERQLAVGFVERRKSTAYPNGNPDGVWDPSDSISISGEIIVVFNSDYDPNGNQIQYTGGTFSTPGGDVTLYSDLVKIVPNQLPPDVQGVTPEQKAVFNSSWFDAMYVVGLEKKNAQSFYSNGDKLVLPLTTYPYTYKDVYRFKTLDQTTIDENARKALFQKVNVFPNPLYGFNPATSYSNSPSDDPFVTFSNLPQDITITIYSLSGNKLRTLTTEDKSSPTSPFLRWDLQNDSGIRVASGLYIAIVNSPKYGQKILKFSIIMPQKQLQKY